MDEAALRRMIGGGEVMAEQMRHLLHMAKLPNIDIQVLPFAVGSHAALVAPFSILEFPDHVNPPIVHVDTVTDSVFFEQLGDVERCNSTFGDIQGAAISTSQTAKLIDDLVKSLESPA